MTLVAADPRDADQGFYTGREGSFLIQLNRASTSPTAEAVENYRLSAAQTGALGPTVRVNAGPAGGIMACWQATFTKVPAVACLVLDGRAELVIVRYYTRDLLASAAQARQLRTLVERF